MAMRVRGYGIIIANGAPATIRGGHEGRSAGNTPPLTCWDDTTSNLFVQCIYLAVMRKSGEAFHPAAPCLR